MRIVIWTEGTICDCHLERNILKRLYGDVAVVGTIAEGVSEKDKLAYDKKAFSHLLKPEKISQVDFDLLVVTGQDGDSPAVMKKILSLGIEPCKVIIDRVIRFPGFTIERYNALRSSNLSILSIDCFAGILYHSLGLPFLTPTINMFQKEKDFLKFLSAPRDYVDKELEFKGIESEPAPSLNVNYPVFALGDIILHMNHWGKLGPEIARQKWEERKIRINWDNLLIFMKTQDRSMLERFAALPYEKKICLTSIKSDLPCAYYVPPEYFEGKPFWRAMSEVGRGSIYEYDLWEFLLKGRKVERIKPVLPKSHRGEKKKILFFALSPATMYLCLAYKLWRYKEDDVVLVVDKDFFGKRRYDKYLARLAGKGIFSEIKYASLMLDRKKMPKDKTSFIAYVNLYFDLEFETENFHLAEFHELAVFQYSWCSEISLYLNYKRVPYQWMQLLPGDLMIRQGRRYPKGLLRDEISFYQAESALAPYARPVLLEAGSPVMEKLQGKDYLFWSPAEALANTDEAVLADILACYEFSPYQAENASVLLLNSNGSGQGSQAVKAIKAEMGHCKAYGFSECDYEEIISSNYALVMDILLNRQGQIYVKSHPNDPLSTKEITEFYGSSVQKFTEAPMELVCAYLRKKKIKLGNVVGVSSSALASVGEDVCCRSMFLTDAFFCSMQYYCSLYVLAILLERMRIQRVFCSERLLENLKILSSIQGGAYGSSCWTMMLHYMGNRIWSYLIWRKVR